MNGSFWVITTIAASYYFMRGFWKETKKEEQESNREGRREKKSGKEDLGGETRTREDLERAVLPENEKEEVISFPLQEGGVNELKTGDRELYNFFIKALSGDHSQSQSTALLILRQKYIAFGESSLLISYALK